MEEKTNEEYVDLTIGMLDSADEGVVTTALLYLGVMAAAGLRVGGISTVYLAEDGHIRMANPLFVYLDPEADKETPDKKIKYVRPIVGDRKPLYVGLKHGRLWEVAFDDEPEQTPSG